MLRGAFARGILQNNAGLSYLKDIVGQNGFKATPYLTHFIAVVDKKRIESEEVFASREYKRRIGIVKAATAESSFKSGQFD